MGVILAKFRKEKSTQEVLEALQDKIDTLEALTVNTQEQKKRFVTNFIAISVGVYLIAFIYFYFVYFPPTLQEKFMYFTPLVLYPIIIIQLRCLLFRYYQRKLNKNSKKLTALRAEKKKILEQVMDKETYKVAVNLLARFADKPSKTAISLTSATPVKTNQSLQNRSMPAQTTTTTQRSNLLSLSTTPQRPAVNSPARTIQLNTPRPVAFASQTGGVGVSVTQHLRRRTPFPILNQQEKGVFDRIVDVLVGDGPQDRFAMICKECYAHNGMALKEDFEYTTFRCAFCNALNPARKAKPVAPRLSDLPALTAKASDTSDSEDDKDDSDKELAKIEPVNAVANDKTTEQLPSALSSSSGDEEDEKDEKEEKTKTEIEKDEEIIESSNYTALDEFIKSRKDSDSPKPMDLGD